MNNNELVTKDFREAKAFADKVGGLVGRGFVTYCAFNPFEHDCYTKCKTSNEYANVFVSAWGYPHYVSDAYANKVKAMWKKEKKQIAKNLEIFIAREKSLLTKV